MNPGYLSYLLISVVFILLASGWKDILLRGVPHVRILLFFVGWFVSGFWTIPWNGAGISLLIPYLLILGGWGVAVMRKTLLQLHVLLSATLVGMFDFVVLELNGWFPFTISGSPVLDSSLVLSVVIVLLGRKVLWQFTALTIGLLIGEGAHHVMHWHVMAGHVAGGLDFSDHWWLTMCCTRGLTVVLDTIRQRSAGLVKSWTFRKNWRD